MCGIAGIIGNGDPQLLQQMLQAQAHRGPDNCSTWQHQQVALGHNRLSIIDLSDAGNQPMHSHSGRYSIVFNGEVYNYRELRTQYLAAETMHSESDTEVVLALYEKMGANMLPLLNGMFAMAIWDQQTQTLFAARDRFGVKPFYYSQQQGQWLFASEIKSLWAAGVPKRPDENVWAGFFAHGLYGQPHETFWQQIAALPAGHCLRLNASDLTPHVQRWYVFEEAVQQQPDVTEATWMEAYHALLQDAVQLRFRADVPVGFNLSGGLDSSTLLAAVHEAFPANQTIRAYSFYCADERYDELPWVQQLIAHTGKPLEAVLLSVKDVPALAAQMTMQQDEPYGGIPTIAYGQVFKTARSMRSIVLLDGQGMDEAWGGYDYYYKAGDGIVQGTQQSPVLPHTLVPAFAAQSQAGQYPAPFDNRLQNLQYRDIFYTKIPRALRFNDRASMLHSTELREPFLDYRLVEFAFAMPADRKYFNEQTKYGLRQYARQYIGSQLALAPKRPLQTPQREWLRHELRDWADDLIQWLSGPGNPGWFDKQAVLTTWQQYLQGQMDNSFFVWQWLNTAMLLQAP